METTETQRTLGSERGVTRQKEQLSLPVSVLSVSLWFKEPVATHYSELRTAMRVSRPAALPSSVSVSSALSGQPRALARVLRLRAQASLL